MAGGYAGPGVKSVSETAMNLTKRVALQDCKQFDEELRALPEWSGWDTRANQLYAVKHKGKLYPPKKILSLATGTPVMELHGGWQTNDVLQDLGLTIVRLK